MTQDKNLYLSDVSSKVLTMSSCVLDNPAINAKI